MVAIKASSGGSRPAQWTVGSDGSLVISPDDPTVAGPLVKIAAPANYESDTSDTGDIFHLVADDGTIVFEADTYGDVTMRGPAGHSNLTLEGDAGSLIITNTSITSDLFTLQPTGLYVESLSSTTLTVRSRGTDDSAFAAVFTKSPGYLLLIGMTGGISVWDGVGTDDSVNQMWWVTKDGYEGLLHRETEPADAAIQRGQMLSWFDATDGAAKFWRKGKTLDGTVVKTSSAMT